MFLKIDIGVFLCLRVVSSVSSPLFMLIGFDNSRGVYRIRLEKSRGVYRIGLENSRGVYRIRLENSRGVYRIGLENSRECSVDHFLIIGTLHFFNGCRMAALFSSGADLLPEDANFVFCSPF